MFFPFLDYQVFTFANQDEGNRVLMATPWPRTLVMVEATNRESGGVGSFRVYAVGQGGLDNETTLGKISTESGGSEPTDSTFYSFPSIIEESGTNIRITLQNENNVTVKLHLFRLP